MSRAFDRLSEICQIVSRTFLKNHEEEERWKAPKMQAGRLRSQWLSLFFVSEETKSLCVR